MTMLVRHRPATRPASTAVETTSRTMAAAAAPQLTQNFIPDLVVQLIVGHASEDSMLTPGFLSFKDVYALTQVSRGWNNFAQPMLDATRTWGHPNVIQRLLHVDPAASFNDQDNKALAFLLINADTPFEILLNIAITVKSWMFTMSLDVYHE